MTDAQIRRLTAAYPHVSTEALAVELGCAVKTIRNWAVRLGLRKSPTALAISNRREVSPEHMATIGAKGGKIGGPARAAKLSGRRRKEIARNAINSRWGR